jgi:hypothetical protein
MVWIELLLMYYSIHNSVIVSVMQMALLELEMGSPLTVSKIFSSISGMHILCGQPASTIIQHTVLVS